MIRLFRRRPTLPPNRQPKLERDERIVAWATFDGDEVVVATNLGLFLPGRERLGWHEIHKATWSGRSLTVVPGGIVERREGYDVVEDLPAVSYTLLDPREVPDQVRTRVTRSVAYSMQYPVPGGGVRVVARRVPGVDGLLWAVRYDPGTDAEVAREVTEELVAAAQAAT